jgi:putative transposase
MILTYKFKHYRDFSKELSLAFKIAQFAFKHPECKSSKYVKHFGLKSMISNQILKKWGNQKNIKGVHNVNLVIPGQTVYYVMETNSIHIPCLNLHFENTIPYTFEKINQAEIDKEFVYISFSVKENPPTLPTSFIGIDRNTTGHVAVTATPSTGKVEKLGKSLLYVHKKYSAIRKRLQREGKFRELKKLKNRESNIIKDLNHKISRKIVDMAKLQHAALVLEDLSGIKNRKNQNRSFNYALHSWSFYQLQSFVEYKAKLLGIPVLYVDPAYTSQDCSVCGSRGIRNGKLFKCPFCGHVDHADVNAAFNIALRQKSMVDCFKKEIETMGALIPHDALFECEATLNAPTIEDVRRMPGNDAL